ncbi:MAG: hypothetical protein FJW63_00015 [Actinobacteria bacterium]|nr:hypothetical protein [Actinomycetota bacterium]
MGADVLHKAIENYKGKQKNKK